MRLIDADALKEVMCMDCDNRHLCTESPACDTVRGIDSMPTIEAEPKHGEWINIYGWVHCSVCHQEPPNESNIESDYCPNCGAKMEGLEG